MAMQQKNNLRKKFKFQKINIYEIEASFPSLTPERLQDQGLQAITKAQYELNPVASLESFRKDIDMEKLLRDG